MKNKMNALSVALESNLQIKVDQIEWRYTKPVISTTPLLAIENHLATHMRSNPAPRLPHALVGLLTLRNGGRPSKSSINKFTMSALLPINANGKGSDIFEIYKMYQEDRSANLKGTEGEIPFAMADNGDLFIYKIDDATDEGIYYWSHETNETTLICDGSDNLIDLFISKLK